MKAFNKLTTVWLSSILVFLTLAGCGPEAAFFSKVSNGLPTQNNPTQPTPPPAPPTPSPSPSPSPQPVNNPIPPLACSAGSTTTPTPTQYYPTACLVPQIIAAGTPGIEINEGHLIPSKTFSMGANDPVNGTSAAANLYIEIATYVKPDTIVINAYDITGKLTQLLDICNISTYNKGDPTNGTMRPYSDTILQFNVTIPAGTVKLVFDYTGSDSPTYVGAWGLGEFSTALATATTNPFNGVKNKSDYYRVQGEPLSVYNDNADPDQKQPMCTN